MKIIKFDPKNPYAEMLYEKLDNFLYWGNEYLPFIFLKKVYMNDGHMLQLPRWITKKHYDSIEKKARKLADELNWE